jgi:benzoyl-CoA reductase/2-hydroxyglutaryl-CoA dehydratase subunit BcrC/BadD/HgdB
MSARPMSFMREKVETQLKPALEMFRADLVPHGRLIAGGLELRISHYEETFRAMDERHKKLGWYEFCLTPELFLAMDIIPFLGEAHPDALTRGTPEACWEYVDIAEAAGVPSELCVLDKVMYGAMLANEMPRADFIVTGSAPCDSSRIGYQMFEQLADCPVFRLDAPVEDSREAHLYYASEIRKLIGFLEEQTGTRLDPDRLREVCEESNRATEAFLEWFELRRARPCPQGSVVASSAYMAMATHLGTPELTRYLEFLCDDGAQAVAEGRGAVPDERHRVLWYNVPVTFDLGLHQWLEESFKVVVLMDQLACFCREDPIDTTSLDTMLLGLARRGLETTMSRLRVTGQKMNQQFLRDYEDLSADCVVFPTGVGCKHVWGWLSLLREICRERGIPICVFDLDWMDSRVRSIDSIRTTLEQFFTTVME